MSQTVGLAAAAPAAAATAPAIIPGSPEHDAAMLARWNDSKSNDPALVEAAAVVAPVRPDSVPEKFWNAETGAVNTEALLKSYSELEKARAAKGEVPNPVVPENVEAASAVTNAGLDWNVLQGKIASGGTIDEADFTALAKSGVPREVVETHVKLLADRVVQERKDAVEYMGGQENADAVLKWAAANLNASEKKSINGLLASPDWRVGLDAVTARMGASARSRGEPETAAYGAAPGTPTGYRSRAEMKTDMGSKQYRTDPAFREAVGAKMRAASWDLDR